MYDITTDGLINRGNLARLKQCMRRAEAGGRLTVGFIGGSITQGAAASDDVFCYAARVAGWWKEQFPKAKLAYVNAGIGATTSQFGAARAKEDLLAAKPDFVVIEFSVNDNDEAPFERRDFFMETYEGLVRQIYGAGCAPAVVLVHNVRYHDGSSEENMHAQIGRFYELPCISIRRTLYSLVKDGEIPARNITPDDLHPNDEGHRLVAESITRFLETVYEKRREDESFVSLPEKTCTDNCYEHAVRYRNKTCRPVMAGFVKDTKKQEGVRDVFKNGWYADQKDAKIVFEVTGSEVAVMYRKSVRKPAPVALAVLDGDEEHGVILDANFTEDWGDKAYMQTIVHHAESGPHMLEIRLTDVAEDNREPFYLINVIASSCLTDIKIMNDGKRSSRRKGNGNLLSGKNEDMEA